jgi:hypothetical protein
MRIGRLTVLDGMAVVMEWVLQRKCSLQER